MIRIRTVPTLLIMFSLGLPFLSIVDFGTRSEQAEKALIFCFCFNNYNIYCLKPAEQAEPIFKAPP